MRMCGRCSVLLKYKNRAQCTKDRPQKHKLERTFEIEKGIQLYKDNEKI